MAKKEKKPEEAKEAPETLETPETQASAETAKPTEADALKDELAQQKESFLRLAAEYDNFRKRTQKEKDGAYTDGKADAWKQLLPVYDNLARAIAQETADSAYKKGVEMTMAELQKIMEAQNVKEFGEVGEAFDPNRHNAVMHTEDENFGENTICQVFAKGFTVGDRVIRFAMVQVAN